MEWVRKWEDDKWNILKGTSGEEFLYDVLQKVAREIKAEVYLLDEPSPEVEAQILARNHDYPDCYLKVDNWESLWETKNRFLFHAAWKKHTEFFEHQERWVRSNIVRKKWNASQIPVRNSRHWGKNGWEWNYVYPKNPAKIFVCSIRSLNGWAQTLLDQTVDAQIYTEHPMFTATFLTQIGADNSPSEVDCAVRTQEHLEQQVKDYVYRMLPRR